MKTADDNVVRDTTTIKNKKFLLNNGHSTRRDIFLSLASLLLRIYNPPFLLFLIIFAEYIAAMSVLRKWADVTFFMTSISVWSLALIEANQYPTTELRRRLASPF